MTRQVTAWECSRCSSMHRSEVAAQACCLCTVCRKTEPEKSYEKRCNACIWDGRNRVLDARIDALDAELRQLKTEFSWVKSHKPEGAP